jgi:hypothetical protein
MRKIFILLLVLINTYVNGQFLTPYQAVQNQPKVEFDYWVYSTHAGNGSTSQYPSPWINYSIHQTLIQS